MTRLRRISTSRSGLPVTGFSLIELMIAMVLGLLVVGGAIGIFLSNQRTYRATENLARVQENARVAFEFMSRDIREAGLSLCGSQVQMANILDDQTNPWWLDWADGIRLYGGSEAMVTPTRGFGTGTVNRVSGTDALDLKAMQDSGVIVSTKMPTASADIEVDGTGPLKVNDVVMICDGSQMTIFQITGLPGGIKLQKNQGGGTPGNCTKGMGSPVSCTGPATGTPYLYGPNASVGYPRGIRWFVGFNGRDGKSLYRAILTYENKVIKETTQEIAEGVTDMKLSYLLAGATDYVAAGTVAPVPWEEVTAVRMQLALGSQEKVGTDGKVLQRSFTNVVTLRNRVP